MKYLKGNSQLYQTEYASNHFLQKNKLVFILSSIYIYMCVCVCVCEYITHHVQNAQHPEKTAFLFNQKFMKLDKLHS